jgi:hypothetical protein
MDETKTPGPTVPTVAVLPAVVTPEVVRRGWRTSEFWLTIAIVGLNHLLGALQHQPGPIGMIAQAMADALATGAYAVSRGMVKR